MPTTVKPDSPEPAPETVQPGAVTSHLVTELSQLFAELREWRTLGQEINAYFAAHPDRNGHYERWVVMHRKARAAVAEIVKPVPKVSRRRR